MRRSLAGLLMVAACAGNDKPATIFSIDVQAGAPLLITALGGTLQLTATPRDSSGHAVSNVPVTWSTGDASVATVNGSGLVTAVGNGSVDIKVTAGG